MKYYKISELRDINKSRLLCGKSTYSLVLCHTMNMLITLRIIDTVGRNINTFNEVIDFSLINVLTYFIF